MGKWDLADSLVESVRYHHRIDDLEQAPESARSLICVVAVADALSYSLGLSIEGLVREFKLEENPAAKVLGLSGEQIENLKETLKETYDANHELMGGAN